jgi:hypothetical protein
VGPPLEDHLVPVEYRAIARLPQGHLPEVSHRNATFSRTGEGDHQGVGGRAGGGGNHREGPVDLTLQCLVLKRQLRKFVHGNAVKLSVLTGDDHLGTIGVGRRPRREDAARVPAPRTELNAHCRAANLREQVRQRSNSRKIDAVASEAVGERLSGGVIDLPDRPAIGVENGQGTNDVTHLVFRHREAERRVTGDPRLVVELRYPRGEEGYPGEGRLRRIRLQGALLRGETLRDGGDELGREPRREQGGESDRSNQGSSPGPKAGGRRKDRPNLHDPILSLPTEKSLPPWGRWRHQSRGCPRRRPAVRCD